MTQLEMENYEEMREALLNAQRIFKLEVDNQWRMLQIATRPLEQTLQALRKQEPGKQVTTAGSHFMCEMSETEKVQVTSGVSNNGGALNETVNDATQNMLVRIDTVNEIQAFEQTELEEDAEERQSGNLEHPGWRRWLLSPAFDIFVAVAIVINLVLVMLRIEYEGIQHEPNNDRTRSSVIDALFDVFENIFTAFFVLELMLRLLAHGFGYLCIVSNFLDTVIVILGCLDVWVFPTVMAGSEPVNLSFLRVFRLIKLMKVLRMVRVVKAFAPLRVLVHAVFSSLGALAWSMLLLFVLQITTAMLLAQMLQRVIKDESTDLAVKEKLWVSFGTMVRAWLSTFEMTRCLHEACVPLARSEPRFLFADHELRVSGDLCNDTCDHRALFEKHIDRCRTRRSGGGGPSEVQKASLRQAPVHAPGGGRGCRRRPWAN